MFQGMEYIYEVYKEKSFSKAAAALFISQPSLSANVKRVENRIGYPIFDRNPKPYAAFTAAPKKRFISMAMPCVRPITQPTLYMFHPA